jgi:hypothetical protein
VERPNASRLNCTLNAATVTAQVVFQVTGGPWWAESLLAGLGLFVVYLGIVIQPDSTEKPPCGASCASAARVRSARSAAVPARAQIIGSSGPAARPDAGRAAIHCRPLGSHTAHAANSRCKAITAAMSRKAPGSRPASASVNASVN